MVAKFSFCATVEQHEKMVKDAVKVRSERASFARREQNEQ